MAKKLFESMTIRNLTLKNRIVMSPMCMYSAAEDGKVTPWHVTHYHSRAVGQVGLIILEATAVKPEGRISVNDLGIWSDEHIEGLQNITSLVKQSGATVGIQLAHAGRKAEVPEEIFAPSAIAFDEQSKTPQEMTLADIQEVIAAFQQAAVRAQQANFDMIEIHAAHGYLINEFLSPLANHRQDGYGGSLENRYRLLKEVVSAVREVWDKAVFVRISAHDYTEGGMTPADYVPVAEWLKAQEVDVIDVSSGAVVTAPIDVYPGYQVPFAELIRQEASVPTGAVGLIHTGIQAEEILKNERADLIFLGRELLRDPYWPYQAAKELRTEIAAPKQYRRGWLF